ncbi:MAG: NYN domain-containing protein [Gammaproteobacteria bacterium]
MVFVDGTNLFNRLIRDKVRITKLFPILELAANRRQLVRAAIYTTEEKFIAAQEIHGSDFADGVRLVYGDSVDTENGQVREKGVDALLVADLVYHAAQKNCNYVSLVSADSDFRFALNRVGDFGCRVGLMAICNPAPPRLKNEADDYWFLNKKWLIDNKYASAT